MKIAYNGFGYTHGARGQVVYAKSLFSGQECRWERADFLGIVKTESLKKWLENTPVKNELRKCYKTMSKIRRWICNVRA